MMDWSFSGTFPAWFLPTLASALALGFCDFCKKHAVKDNAAAPVLFFSTLSGTTFFVLATALSGHFLETVICDGKAYALIWLKAVIVGSSWWCVYFALRDLPISIAAPIRASAPVWTFIGSLFLFGEVPTWIQALAMLLAFGGYCVFSLLGKLEGFPPRSPGMVWMWAGTLLGAVSALYDKFLLHSLQLPRATVQFHFSVNLIPLIGIAYWITSRRGSETRRFEWRWSIVLAGVLLIAADYLYFYAVGLPDIKISIVSLVRRCGCIVPFALGAWYFHDRHMRGKVVALALILIGVAILGLC